MMKGGFAQGAGRSDGKIADDTKPRNQDYLRPIRDPHERKNLITRLHDPGERGSGGIRHNPTIAYPSVKGKPGKWDLPTLPLR